MTVEHRFVVGLGDICAVTLECKKCKARLSRSPDAETQDQLAACPSCEHPWLSFASGGARLPASSLRQFVEAIAPSRVCQTDDEVGVRVLLEFAVPSGAPSPASK